MRSTPTAAVAGMVTCVDRRPACSGAAVARSVCSPDRLTRWIRTCLGCGPNTSTDPGSVSWHARTKMTLTVSRSPRATSGADSATPGPAQLSAVDVPPIPQALTTRAHTATAPTKPFMAPTSVCPPLAPSRLRGRAEPSRLALPCPCGLDLTVPRRGVCHEVVEQVLGDVRDLGH